MFARIQSHGATIEALPRTTIHAELHALQHLAGRIRNAEDAGWCRRLDLIEPTQAVSVQRLGTRRSSAKGERLVCFGKGAALARPLPFRIGFQTLRLHVSWCGESEGNPQADTGNSCKRTCQ